MPTKTATKDAKSADEKMEKEKDDMLAEEDEEEKLPDPVCPPTEVFLHSLPLLSTVDHYTRLTANTRTGKRVVGILLGHNVNGKVHCTNSFAIPFEEDPKNQSIWYLDHHYLENMFSMFKKVNTKEAIVGWYSTGPKLKVNDMEINQVVARYCVHPIYIIIRVTDDRSEGLPCTAYKAIEEIENEATGPKMTFAHLHTTLRCSAMEEVGVVHLLRDIQDYTVSSLATQVKEKISSLRAIESKLQEIRDYMELVADDKLPLNHNILYTVQDIFNTLPSLHHIRQSTAIAQEVNDQTMVTYLGSLLRSVVALHNLILNKFEVKRLKEQQEEAAKKKLEEQAKKEKEEKEEKEAKEKEAEEKKAEAEKKPAS
ncbi:26S proteasome non-ATPase regulatory subunit 7-like protein B [Diplonema papillatum]|nr:26S proteasome non-ATPase regulatory subunit 7-like protein B [Diplonema papillatum]|eukprot:gene18245-28118_t